MTLHFYPVELKIPTIYFGWSASGCFDLVGTTYGYLEVALMTLNAEVNHMIDATLNNIESNWMHV